MATMGHLVIKARGPVAAFLLVGLYRHDLLPDEPHLNLLLWRSTFWCLFYGEKKRQDFLGCQRRGTRHPLQAPSHDAQRVKFPGVSPDIASVPPGSRNTAPHPSVPTKLSESLKALA